MYARVWWWSEVENDKFTDLLPNLLPRPSCPLFSLSSVTFSGVWFPVSSELFLLSCRSEVWHHWRRRWWWWRWVGCAWLSWWFVLIGHNLLLFSEVFLLSVDTDLLVGHFCLKTNYYFLTACRPKKTNIHTNISITNLQMAIAHASYSILLSRVLGIQIVLVQNV